MPSYYISSSTGLDTNNGTQETPWRTIAKAIAASLQPGDAVLLKRGDTFYETVTPQAGGNSISPITFADYGTGSKPVVSANPALTNWTQQSGNIYYASLDVPFLNLVTVNGQVKGMGRYPTTGYLAYTGHSGNASITGATISALPFDPTGGEAVIRKNRWILDRHTVTSRSSNTLNISTSSAYGSNNVYQPVDGNGYFIQNHLGTLAAFGDWYYDKAAKRLYLHFGSGAPAGVTVKAGAADRNVYINYWQYIIFKNIVFEGANIDGAYHVGTGNIGYVNCEWRNQGGNSVYGIDTSGLAVGGCTITDSLNNGIWGENNMNNVSVTNSQILNIGLIAGAGRSGDSGQEGIYIAGNNVTIQLNKITNTGYTAINFLGNNVLVDKNRVDTFCSIKDDGAGIYTYTGNASTINVNRVISNNIVLNGIGAFAGAEGYFYEPYGKAAGIYADDYANNVQMIANTVAHAPWNGIFLHNAKNNQITNNTVFDCQNQMEISQDVLGVIRGNVVSGNKLTAKAAGQNTLYMHAYQSDNISQFAAFSNNTYARPADDSATIRINKEYSGGTDVAMSLAQWQTVYNQDVGSKKSPISVVNPNDLIFAYSDTDEPITVPLTGAYKKIGGEIAINSAQIAPFTGGVFIPASIKQLTLSASVLTQAGKRVVTLAAR